MTRKTLKEMTAQPAKFFVQLKEIARHPEGFAGWERDDIARIEKNRNAREAWVRETVEAFAR